MLDKLGVDYSIPNLPGHRKPKSKDWVEIIKKETTSSDKPVVLVGHSLGTRVILHSKDDSFLDYKENGVVLSKELEAKLITCDGRNHFCSLENAPYILEFLRRELKF